MRRFLIYAENPSLTEKGWLWKSIEMEFANQEDVAAYERLDSIMAVDAEHNNYAESWVFYVFELRSDYINEHNK